jgi:leucyl-tRNA synthetase
MNAGGRGSGRADPGQHRDFRAGQRPVRARVSIPGSATQGAAVAAAMTDANVQKFMEGKPVKKAIYVPGKLVNIVV